MRWAGHVAHIGNAYRVLVGKPKGKRPLRRSRCRWESSIKIGIRKMEWGDKDWIDLTQDEEEWRALMKTAMNHRAPEMFGNS
jgi:hypothetical protein